MRKTSAPAVVYLYTIAIVVYLYTLTLTIAGAAYVTLRMAEDRRRPRHAVGLDAETIAAARTIARGLIS